MPRSPALHRRSVRLSPFDDRTADAYFVTVCTAARAPVLARLSPGSVRLTDSGRIVATEWRLLAVRRPEVRLDAFVVMPDHLHFVVWIPATPPGTGPNATPPGTGRRGVVNHAPTHALRAPLAGSLGIIVNTFKAGVTRRVNERRGTPGAPFWQRGFYEHIVRDAADLARIRRYIADNPTRRYARQDP